MLKPISPAELKQRLESGEAILIDIREADEHARAHIAGARLAPASAIEVHDFAADRAKVAVFHCRSGARTQANAARLLAMGFREAFFLEGGPDAWRAGGFPVRVNHGAPLAIMRQVQITAGALILAGSALGALVHPGFYALPGAVGVGLTFAGVSGWCGMARLLALMPWNRPAAA